MSFKYKIHTHNLLFYSLDRRVHEKLHQKLTVARAKCWLHGYEGGLVLRGYIGSWDHIKDAKEAS